MYEWSKGISLVWCDELVDGEADADNDEDNVDLEEKNMTRCGNGGLHIFPKYHYKKGT